MKESLQKFLFLTGALALFVFGFSVSRAAPIVKAQKGFVVLQDRIGRYAEYTPAKAGQPTIILINGLVYNIDRWSPFSEPLRQQGYGILNYYFRGQSLTLRQESLRNRTPAFFTSGIELKDFSDELFELIQKIQLRGPFVVVGLSFGSSIAAEFAKSHPEIVSNLILMSPLVIPLDKYDPTGAWLSWNLEQIKFWWGPIFGQAFYDMAYRQIYKTYLNQRIVPDRVPDELRDRPEIYKEAIFQLTRSTREFDLRNYRFENQRPNSVHYLLAQEEEAAVSKDQVAAYQAAIPRSRGVLIYLPKAFHAIPDSEGAQAAVYVDLLIQKDRRLKPGAYIETEKGLKPWK